MTPTPHTLRTLIQTWRASTDKDRDEYLTDLLCTAYKTKRCQNN